MDRLRRLAAFGSESSQGSRALGFWWGISRPRQPPKRGGWSQAALVSTTIGGSFVSVCEDIGAQCSALSGETKTFWRRLRAER